MSAKVNLLQLYCEKFKCPPEAFNRTILWRSVRPLARPLTHLAVLLKRDFFESDLELIEDIKKATSVKEVSQLIATHCNMHPTPNRLMTFLGIRVSKRRLKRLARQVFERANA